MDISLISPILTIIGWSIAYRLAKVNSTRTESKSIIDSCGSIIENLSEKGSSFFLSQSSTTEQKKSFEYYAVNKITFLHKKLEYLEKRGIIIPLELISDFHVALTYFIPNHGSPDLKAEKCVNKILKSSSDIIFKLQIIFHEKYPPIDTVLSVRHYFNNSISK